MIDEVKMRADYFRLMNMNGAAHVYREAMRQGILDVLAKEPMNAAELSRVCGTQEKSTSLLLEVLAALGLVDAVDEAYSVTPLAGMLIGGGYRELGDLYWAHLPQFLKTGKPMAAMDSLQQSEAHYQKQAAALGWMLGPAAEAAAQLLSNQQQLIEKVLDIGAGSAIWSLSLAKHVASTTVTAVDWPAVLEVAKQTAARFGLSDRLELIAGNYHEVDLPMDLFDLAIVGNVTHLETVEGNRKLFRKLHSALKPGGRIAVMDIFPGQAEGDINRTLYALGLALRTQQGQVHTPQALEALLVEAGFGQVSLCELPVPPYAVGMMTGSKL